MRLLSTSAALPSLAAILLLAAGCASGGGGDHTGRDAGPQSGDDAGPIGSMDSGTTPIPDSGPNPIPDSGPTPNPDSGPGTECTTDADCDDHLVCTGVERCEEGVCVPGTPPTCDDGIACTVSRCVEGTPMCEHIPDDSLCPAGEVCGPSGCTSSCGESPCRLVSPQCGCASGQGCYLNGTVRQCGAAGSAGEGQPCSGATSCQPGLVCLNIGTSASPLNQCHRFCNTDSDCVGAGSLCIYTLNDGMGGAIPGVRVCSRACDPVTNAGCPAGAACHIYQESTSPNRLFTDCAAPAGTGWEYTPCWDDSDCEPGLFCDGYECIPYCRIGGYCPYSEPCRQFNPPATIGGTTYGYCDL